MESGIHTYNITKHPKLHTFLGEEAIGNLLFGIIFCRCTGRVSALNAFAKHAHSVWNKNSTRIPPFMLEMENLMLLLSFLHSTCGSDGAGRVTKSWSMQQY